METELVKEQETVSQLELSVQAGASESQALKRVQSLQYSWSVNLSYKDESGLICNVNLQDLQKSQSLLASAQAELHHIKEKNMDLKRCNVLLEQETLKVGSKYTNTHFECPYCYCSNSWALRIMWKHLFIDKKQIQICFMCP